MAARETRKIELDFQLNQPQFDAFNVAQPGNTVMTGWSRGVGKSWWHRFIWWSLVAQWDNKLRPNAPKPFRGVRIVVLMPTLKQFKDVHGDGIQNEILSSDGDWKFLGGRFNAQSGSIRFPGGSWVKPMPASAYNSRTARGLRADVVAGDECDDIACDVHDSVAIPWLSEPWSLQMEILGGTPTRGRHGLWYRTMDDGRKGARLRAGESPEEVGVDPEHADALKRVFSFHATYKDAPETVSPNAVARAKATTPRATFEREWEANPDAGEGLIFPDFDPDFHVRTPPADISFREILVGADFGDVDPGVLLKAGIQGHGQDSVLWLTDEWYETACLNSVWDDRAVAWRGAIFYPDPSRQDRIRDWRAKGLDVRDLPADMKPIAAGIARLADLMFRRKTDRGDWCRFYVSPKCKNFIREVGLYRRKKERDGTFSEEPEDKNNHCLVAGTMVETDRGPVAIELVKPGDMVWTSFGLRSVTNAWKSGIGARVMTIKLASGRSLTGTPEHRVWTDRGWVALDALRYSDKLCAWESTVHPSESDTTAKPSGDIRSQLTKTLPGTSGAKKGDTFTGSSGKSCTGQSRPGTTSTTRTGTRSTIAQTILNACRQLSTLALMRHWSHQSEPRGEWRIWLRLGRSRWPGTNQKPVEHGTPSTDARHGKGANRTTCHAATAANHSSHFASDRPGIASVTTGANPTTAAHSGSTTCSERASSARHSSRSASTRKPRTAPDNVLLLREEPAPADVFDLTVDGAHEFFANGLLVHNSIDSARYLASRFGRVETTRKTTSGR